MRLLVIMHVKFPSNHKILVMEVVEMQMHETEHKTLTMLTSQGVIGNRFALQRNLAAMM